MSQDNVININEKDYKLEDLDNKSKYIVAQIRDLEGKVASAKFQLDQHEIAKKQYDYIFNKTIPFLIFLL